MQSVARAKRPAQVARPRGRVVRISPAAVREREVLAARGVHVCVKCGSGWVVLEPAFLHCRFCGNLHRRPGGSLLLQEEFEIRSGLRLAS